MVVRDKALKAEPCIGELANLVLPGLICNRHSGFGLSMSDVRRNDLYGERFVYFMECIILEYVKHGGAFQPCYKVY